MTANLYVLDRAIYLEQRDRDAIARWAHTMFKRPDLPLADRVETATREAEAWFYGEERARAVQQVHLAEQVAS